MKSLTAHKFSMAANIFFATCLAFSAYGSANVFDDAVFWFRGGKDCVNADGYMQQGEFFDDLHADDASHANHKSSMVNYSIDAFRGNAAFRTERVAFPALGNSAEKDMQVLRLSNKAVKNGGVNYFWPEVVNPRSVFANNNITNEYTIISRMRLDDDGLARTQCVFKVGYKASENRGLWLGFSELQSSKKAKYITGRCTSAESGRDASFRFPSMQIPTNTWFDMSIVVGNGKLRIGIALPETLEIHGNNSTIAFTEIPMLTANSLSTGDDYRLFCYTGQATYQLQSGADLTCFIGSMQQLAIWGRALSDQEVMAAFGMPRPAIFRTGFDNGNSNEFGGTRSGVAQTIDGLGSWQGIWDTMQSGDTWTVNFNALRDEAGLAQIFSLRSLPSSDSADIEVALNGTSLGTRRVIDNARVFWPVATNLVVEGANNTLTIRRTDGGAGSFRVDAMELGGSLGVGKETGSITDDQRVYPDRIATGVPSAADPNTQHWPVGLQPYGGVTNLHFRVWVDPDVVDKATSRFWTHTQCANRNSTHTIQGGEEFRLYVNGTQKATRDAGTSWEKTELTFQPGELNGGWNDFEFISANYQTCHWLFGYYRFETVLSRAFSLPPSGMAILVR